MAIKGILYVSAYVSDLARSKKFYGETLVWTLNTDEKDVAGFAFGSGYLVIHGPSGDQATKPKAGGMQVEVLVEDVDAEHARLKNLGLDVGEPTDQPWGERNFFFSDPDGYVWSYGQHTRGHE